MPARQFAWLTPPTEEHPKGKFHRSSKPMETDEQMQMAVKHHWQDACYESTYRFAEWTGGRLPAEVAKSAIIDVIYLDFDDKDDPQRALRDAAEVAAYVGHTTQWWSGMKGAGMLIHCLPVNLIPDLKGSVVLRFALDLINRLPEIETADVAVIGDLNRVHRIIDTKHQETGLYAIGLTADELATLTIDEIKEMAKRPRELVQRPTPSMWVTSQLYRIEDEILTGKMTKLYVSHQISHTSYHTGLKRLKSTTFRDRAGMYNEIKALEGEWRRIQVKRAKTEVSSVMDRRVGRSAEETWLINAVYEFKVTGRVATGSRQSEHKGRVHIAKLAHECGWTFGEICDIFTGADDYNRGITERMVRSCIGR